MAEKIFEKKNYRVSIIHYGLPCFKNFGAVKCVFSMLAVL